MHGGNGRGRPGAGLAELDRLSAALGRGPEQVQAAGGNTSWKEADVLWVKASGLWLADALERDIFVDRPDVGHRRRHTAPHV